MAFCGGGGGGDEAACLRNAVTSLLPTHIKQISRGVYSHECSLMPT